MITSHEVWSSDLERVSAIVLRSMRRPLLFMIAVSAITVFGMVLMPGLPDARGQPTHMSFFHAVYFLGYTATTTGFGEIPREFSNAQRLWGLLSLFMSVVAWVYAIGAIVGLLQNPNFRRVVQKRRFSLSVGRIREPFFIICGFGDTGSLLTRGLVDAGYSATVIDRDDNRIQALQLRDYPVTVPGLVADAGVPRNLITAGLEQENCQGVIAITNDEGINRKIVIMTHLINPKVRVICRSTSEIEEEFLHTLAGVTVVNPFEIFANQLSTFLYRPSLYAISEWLAGASVDLAEPVRPPRGTWVVCGFGRMGKHLERALREREVPTVVIDPDPEMKRAPEGRIIGHSNARTLHAAGVENAAGIITATNSDSNNLGILLNARMLNPRIFSIVRQNRHDDEAAFQAASANLVMQSSLVIARKILFVLLSPLIHPFLEYMHDVRIKVLVKTLHRLRGVVGAERLELWMVIIPNQMACEEEIMSADFPNLPPKTENGEQPVDLSGEKGGKAFPSSATESFCWTLDDIMRNPANRDIPIACVPLVLKRWQQATMLPKGTETLRPGDRILFCGPAQARYQLKTVLQDPVVRRYLVTGVEEPRGFLLNWLFQRRFLREMRAFRKAFGKIRIERARWVKLKALSERPRPVVLNR
uniref:Trk K+ transport system, NAD-binding component n=1 Tax=Candidatus Kentrum eta TaxID=2126337 RepID=A0A450UQQ3_9GAMM|nr:MAG: Trk K+ transport system, NAD-binding component [Candidatus Kentron sp. H]VFJ94882.1 MAG: Trk K+ transport system, NAD-binding component [Candidatus Kentron sp. H]VFK01389.1 MAG: Trk K+ transport system, NAD-binding component [Candidatus Kentron sp. H]